MSMTIRNSRTKIAIIKIDDEGNMTLLDDRGTERPYPDPVEVAKLEEEVDGTGSTD